MGRGRSCCRGAPGRGLSDLAELSGDREIQHGGCLCVASAACRTGWGRPGHPGVMAARVAGADAGGTAGVAGPDWARRGSIRGALTAGWVRRPWPPSRPSRRRAGWCRTAIPALRCLAFCAEVSRPGSRRRCRHALQKRRIGLGSGLQRRADRDPVPRRSSRWCPRPAAHQRRIMLDLGEEADHVSCLQFARSSASRAAPGDEASPSAMLPAKVSP
jgi:hypothetical protein